jgi:hypothetical protein
VCHDGLSVRSFGPLHHDCNDDVDVIGAVGSAAAGSGTDPDDCAFVVGATPDSARVTSSAKRNRLSKAARSCVALSCAAVNFVLEADAAAPYAHEPTTTAAIVNPCATIRTRNQLLSERDWPLRIFVMAMTSATVVAAAPVRVLSKRSRRMHAMMSHQQEQGVAA